MKDIFTILTKMYGKPAVKCSIMKKEIRSIEQFFEERHLSCQIKNDMELIEMSAKKEALQQKELLDEQLFRSLDSMHDYMYTLHYEDINRLLLVDLKDLLQRLKQFDYRGNTIVLPCFTEEINQRYVLSPALYTYPSYSFQLRHYASYMQWGTYGNLPYEAGFGLLKLLEKDGEKDRGVFYFPQMNRFFLLEHGICVQNLSLPDKLHFDDDILHAYAKALLAMNVQKISTMLKENAEIKKKLKKKLEKVDS